MCGRFALRRLPQQMLLDLKVDDIPDLQPRYNIAPTQEVPLVRQGHGSPTHRELAMLRWGLVPPWAEDPKLGAKMINARSETLDTKSAFKKALTKRRCLILADGYYEWETLGKRKQPYLIALEDHRPFLMAGLWERWFGHASAKLDQPLESCTIITTEANSATSGVHDRMPVILPKKHAEHWLRPHLEVAESMALLQPYGGDDLTVTKVSTYVNNARHEGAACVEEIRELF